MKCNQCGAESTEGIFCSYCGAKLIDPYVASTTQARQELLDRLKAVYQVAAECDPHYAAFNQWQQDIDIRSYQKYEIKKTWKTIFFIGLPIAILSGLPMLIEPVVASGIIVLSYLTMLAVWIFAFVKVKKTSENQIQQQRDYDQMQIQNGYEQQAKILEHIRYIFSNSDIAAFFPPEYLYLDAVNQICDYVNTMKADTLEEAIDLYEQTLHRIRIENIQNEQYLTLRRAEALWQQTANAAAFAAVMSGLSAVRSFRR